MHFYSPGMNVVCSILEVAIIFFRVREASYYINCAGNANELFSIPLQEPVQVIHIFSFPSPHWTKIQCWSDPTDFRFWSRFSLTFVWADMCKYGSCGVRALPAVCSAPAVKTSTQCIYFNMVIWSDSKTVHTYIPSYPAAAKVVFYNWSWTLSYIQIHLSNLRINETIIS